MAGVLSLRRKIEDIKPQNLLSGLKAGVVGVAIVKPDVSVSGPIDVNDVFWAKCPTHKTVATLSKAFKQAEVKPVHLFQGDELLNPNKSVSDLVTNEKLCIVRAIYQSYDPRSTSRGSPLHDVTNTAVNRTAASLPPNHKPPSTPGPLNFKSLPTTPVTAPKASSDSQISAQHSPTPSSTSAIPYVHDPLTLAWMDFVFDRRECLSRSVVVDSEVNLNSIDATIRDEWQSLCPQQRQYFVDRTRQCRFANLQDHRGFWVWYYNRSDAAVRAGGHPHATFETTHIFFLDTHHEWTNISLQTRAAFFSHAISKYPAYDLGIPLVPKNSFLAPRNGSMPQPPQPPQPSQTSEPLQPIQNRISDGARADAAAEAAMKQAAEPVIAEDSVPAKFNVAELLEGRSIEQLESAMAKGSEILTSIKSKLESEPSEESEHWLKSIANLQKQVVRTKTVVGVVGATGAGKSSVINAMLDQERLVPTNCMRACTAVVTEISYNHEEIPYRAEIDFITKDDWMKELKTSFQDLLDGSGKVSRESTNEDSEAGIAYAKIKAVYPLMTKEEMETTTIEKLLEHKNVKNVLGDSQSIEHEDSPAFYKMLQRYVDSKEKVFGKKKTDIEKLKARQMEFWPLIRVVRLYVKAPALATGAVIVDLPGVHDSNQARAAVAQGYLKQCTGLWIVAPITRAVDDKSAKTLLGDTFKRQLKMDGGYNSVTFICSKTDDISITEAQDSLGLDGEMAPLYARSEELEEKGRGLKKELEELKTRRSDIMAAMDSVEEQLEVWETLASDLEDGKTVFAPKAENNSTKRKRDDQDQKVRKRPKYSEDSEDDFIVDDDDNDESAQGSDDEDTASASDRGEPLTAEAIDEQISGFKASKKEGRRERLALDEPMKELHTRIAEIQKERNEIDDELLGRCIKGRNQYSRGAIQQDFASGIRELDQEIAEEEDAANFNPDVDKRDYDVVAQSLPVFCVSSRGYQQLMGRLTKDKRVTTFRDLQDTEIPALQAHCTKLTVTNREVSCKRFLNNLSQFLNSLRLWSSSDGTALNLTDEQHKKEAEILGSKLRKLDTELENAVTSICRSIDHEIDDQLYDKFPIALQAGKAAANDTQARWGAPVNRDNRTQGGLYWVTYKATVRRDGVFRDLNFNNDLVEPIIKNVTPGWEKVFIRRLPQILAELSNNVLRILTTFHNEVETRATKLGTSIAAFQMLKQQLTTYREVAKDAANMAKELINDRQKDINREFVPIVAEKMLPAYAIATAECGSGSYARMKSAMRNHVETAKDIMFQESLDYIKRLLKALLKDTEDMMLAKLDEVYMTVKRDYESVVVGRSRGANQGHYLSKQQRKVRREVLDIVDGVEVALKQITGLEPIDDVKEGSQIDQAVQNGEDLDIKQSELPDKASTSSGPDDEARDDLDSKDLSKDQSHNTAKEEPDVKSQSPEQSRATSKSAATPTTNDRASDDVSTSMHEAESPVPSIETEVPSLKSCLDSSHFSRSRQPRR